MRRAGELTILYVLILPYWQVENAAVSIYGTSAPASWTYSRVNIWDRLYWRVERTAVITFRTGMSSRTYSCANLWDLPYWRVEHAALLIYAKGRNRRATQPAFTIVCSSHPDDSSCHQLHRMDCQYPVSHHVLSASQKLFVVWVIASYTIHEVLC